MIDYKVQLHRCEWVNKEMVFNKSDGTMEMDIELDVHESGFECGARYIMINYCPYCGFKAETNG